MARLTKLRVKDDTGNFPNTYPIGAEAENVIFNSGDNLEEKIDAIENEMKDSFNRYLQIFEVLDNANDEGQMLYSAYNTAYKEFKDNMVVVTDGNHLIVEDDNTLYLISKYFDIEDSNDGTGHQTLIINIKDSYI